MLFKQNKYRLFTDELWNTLMLTDFFAQTLLSPSGPICFFEHFEIFFLFSWSCTWWKHFFKTKIVWTDFFLKTENFAPAKYSFYTQFFETFNISQNVKQFLKHVLNSLQYHDMKESWYLASVKEKPEAELPHLTSGCLGIGWLS